MTEKMSKDQRRKSESTVSRKRPAKAAGSELGTHVEFAAKTGEVPVEAVGSPAIAITVRENENRSADGSRMLNIEYALEDSRGPVGHIDFSELTSLMGRFASECDRLGLEIYYIGLDPKRL